MILTSPATSIPELVIGEKPAPLVYQFQDGAGAPLVITGYQAKVNIKEHDAAAPSISGGAAVVTNGANGEVTYTWAGTEFPTPGQYEIEIWVGNGAQRFCSVIIQVPVRFARGPVPAI
jgi:hypothetical protein